MEKIKSFNIKTIKLFGFKKFSEETEFDFGNMTSICGHNGQGKTSIAEAITYAITGAPYFGGEKSLDRLYSIGSKDMRLSLIIDADGSEHKLTRSRIKDTTTITYDGIQIKQSDLTTMLGERDLFLSIFNPLYFIEVLGDKGRNLLERYIPPVSHEDIMAGLSKGTRERLINAKMTSPEALLKQLNGDIKSLNESLIYTEGQKDILETQASDRQKTLEAKEAEKAEIAKRMTALLQKRNEGVDFDAIKQRRDALIAKGKNDAASGVNEKAIELVRAIEKRRAEAYVSKFSEKLSEAQRIYDDTVKKFEYENTTHSSIKAGVECPTCKRTVTESDVGALKSVFEKNLEETCKQGSKVSVELSQLKELDRKAIEVFEKFRADDIAKMEAELESLGTNNMPVTSNMDGLVAEINALDKSLINGNLSDEEVAEFTALKDRLTAVQAEIGTLSSQEEANSPKKLADMDSLRQCLRENQDLASAVKLYISERVKLMFGCFDMFQNVSLQLYDVVKSTGEVKDVFKFTYDGRPYNYLSYSEKIKAGLEISELLKSLTHSDYPVFVDNGESVPVIDNIKPSGQIIVSQVVKGAALNVKILSAADELKSRAGESLPAAS